MRFVSLFSRANPAKNSHIIYCCTKYGALTKHTIQTRVVFIILASLEYAQ